MKSGKPHVSKMKRSIAIEIIRNNEIEIPELKNTVNAVGSAVESISSRLDQAEKRMCKLKGHLKFPRGGEMKTSMGSPCELWDTSKRNSVCVMGVPEGIGKGVET